MKLLVADDAPDITEVVAFGARMTWPQCEVLVAQNGTEALRLFEQERPDFVVLDVSMPPPDGFEVCRRIREVSQVPILMLTVRDATLDKVRAFDFGADDYLTKPFDHLELLARMRALARRTAPLATTATDDCFTLGSFSLDFAGRRVEVDGREVPLTSTEYRLLETLVRQAGTPVGHRQLLETVWGPEYVSDTSYLKVFIGRLRRKLGDDAERPRFIHTEWGAGYCFGTPRPSPAA